MKKTIIHVITSLKIGGAEMLLPQLISDLGLEEWQHEVVCFYDGPVRKILEEKNIKTTKIAGLLCSYDPVFIYKLFKHIKNNKPNIIHSALWAANFLCRIIAWVLKTPHVSVLHLEVEHEGKIRNILDSFTYKLSQQVVTVSSNVTQSLKRQKWLPAHKIIEITNGINIIYVQKMVKKQAICREQFGILPHDFVIGSVGRLIPRKNFDVLIKSFAQVVKTHPATKLVIVGSGPEEQRLRLLIQNSECSHAIFLVTNQQAFGYYALFNCFVLASQAEGLSVALLEALSMRLPVVVTGDLRASVEQQHPLIQNNYNGLVIETSNSVALKQALASLIASKKLADTLADFGEKTLICQGSSVAMAERYRALFIAVCSNN